MTEVQQVGVGLRGLGQPRVVELLAGPGRLAEVGQTDHPRAALERVERAPHGGQLAEVIGGLRQRGQRLPGPGQHLARFLEEDRAHLGVVLEPGRCGSRRDGRRSGQVDDQPGDRARDLLAHLVALEVAVGIAEVAAGVGSGIGQRRQACALRLLGELLEPAGDLVVVDVGAHGLARQRLGLGLHAGFARRRRHRGPDLRAQQPGRGIELEQRPRQRRLHAQHVDQEAQRAEVGGQALDAGPGVGPAGALAGEQQRVDVVAHAQHRVRGVVGAEHREDAAHGLQVRGRRSQRGALGGVAEVGVDQLLGLGQRGAQLVHDAAHGLAVADAAVERLHPVVERAGIAARTRQRDALGQALHALGLPLGLELAFVDRGLDPQQGGGDFHGQRGRGRRRAHQGVDRGAVQRLAEQVATGEQPAQRVVDQRELLAQPDGMVQLAGRGGRPGVLGRGDALARLHDPGRVVTPERGGLVVDAGARGQAVRAAHRSQPGRGRRIGGGAGLRAVEQQLAAQALGVGGDHAGARAGAQLRQQPRGHPLDVDVAGQQALGQPFEEGCRQWPQRGVGLPGTALAEPGVELAQARCCAGRPAQQRQRARLDLRAQRIVEHACRGRGIGVEPGRDAAFEPQVGRVRAVVAGQRLHRAILRKQGDRRDRLASEPARQEVDQRERGLLDQLDRCEVGQRRPGDQALHRGLAGAQQRGGRRQADQLERADRLVQLRTRLAQHGRVDRVDVGQERGLGLAQIAPQRLVRGLERAPHLVVHPGQRAQVLGVRGGDRSRGHRGAS